MTDNPFDLYTHTVCEGGNGDIPGWMFLAICALPYVLIVIGIIGD